MAATAAGMASSWVLHGVAPVVGARSLLSACCIVVSLVAAALVASSAAACMCSFACACCCSILVRGAEERSEGGRLSRPLLWLLNCCENQARRRHQATIARHHTDCPNTPTTLRRTMIDTGVMLMESLPAVRLPLLGGVRMHA